MSTRTERANAIRGWPWTPFRQQQRPSRRADGPGRRRRGLVARPLEARSQRPAAGSTAIASCCPTATARCCMYSLAAPDGIRRLARGPQETSGSCIEDRRAPGVGECPGVETTTGPLGQGLPTRSAWRSPSASSAASSTARRRIVDHRTWVVAGDGCLMEGISHEAASLAGTLGARQARLHLRRQWHLHRRRGRGLVHRRRARAFRGIWLARYRDVDGHDADEVLEALNGARGDGRPTLVCCRTTIGFGSPNKAGTAGVARLRPW